MEVIHVEAAGAAAKEGAAAAEAAGAGAPSDISKNCKVHHKMREEAQLKSIVNKRGNYVIN